jgi:hypothetical protein
MKSAAASPVNTGGAATAGRMVNITEKPTASIEPKVRRGVI